MSTRYKIAEQVMSLLRGGAPSPASSIKMPEIKIAIGQVINKLLKTEFYTTHIAEERNTNGLVTAHYEKVKVEKYGSVSRSFLPAFPVKLIKNMGIALVYKPGCRNDPFIPIPNGMAAFLPTEPLISDVLGQTTYEQVKNFLIYNKDLTGEKINEVSMELVVSDIDSYTDFELLPIPADMEHDVLRLTYQALTGQQMPDKHIDPNAEYKTVRP